MTVKRVLKAALPMLLVGAPLLADDTVEIHGYMRSGVGRSSEGGEQIAFGLGVIPNPGDLRLGNEDNHYVELAIDVKAYEKGNTAFKLHFRPAYKQSYSAQDGAYDRSGGGNAFTPNQKILFRETWGEATGVFGKSNDLFKDASIWVGRRFYQRQDVHMLDYWFWDNEGQGAGIENINLGFAKFHAAYIQQDTSDNSGGNIGNGGGVNIANPNGKYVISTYDFRLSDIITNPGGSLTVGLTLQKPANLKTADTVATQTGGNTNGGYRVDLMHRQGGILGGDNLLAFNYRVGAGMWGWYNPDRGDKNKTWEILDSFYIAPTKQFALNLVGLYRDEGPVTGVGGADAVGHRKSMIIAARPTFFITNHFSIVAEIGREEVKYDNFFAAGTAKIHLNKETIAFQWQPQASYWSRPSIRLFMTNAQWGTAANPNASWQSYTPPNFAATKSNGFTYGAQIEAWW
jgi:maltoporin